MEQVDAAHFEPKRIVPEKKEAGFSRILSGPPESAAMHAGLVRLRPGETVGVHSTERKEELIIVLEGRGDFVVSGRKPVEIREGTFFYCPPDTEHDVHNTGTAILKYVYVVSRAV